MKKKESLSDEELVEVVRREDNELYIEVVKRYQEKLLRYAGYLVNDESIAEDVVQESFIKAYKNLFSFDVRKKFSSWIYRIVHNEAINYLRKNKNEVSYEANKGLVDLMASNEDVELAVERKELVKKVRECLGFLPLNYREPLSLFFLEEKNYEEISDILRMPIGTVGTRINRGKAVLKKICEKKGGKDYV